MTTTSWIEAIAIAIIAVGAMTAALTYLFTTQGRVAVYLEKDTTVEGRTYLCVKNFGALPISGMTVSFDPEPRSMFAGASVLDEVRDLYSKSVTLMPGQEMRSLWNSGPFESEEGVFRDSVGAPDVVTVKTRVKIATVIPRTLTFVLDNGLFDKEARSLGVEMQEHPQLDPWSPGEVTGLIETRP